MATAQETFKAMMKQTVGPGLRALGFQGSGQNYLLPSLEYWAMLGFQKAKWSDARQVGFTGNILVVSRATWADARREQSYFPERPTANTYWSTDCWQKRIGEVLPGGGDLWWELPADQDWADLASAVLWAVRDYVLPTMQKHMK
jgi:Domain of unknown function (DUF4304)